MPKESTVNLKARIENDFNYHAVNPVGVNSMASLRFDLRTCAKLIEALVPDGRERCIALTRLEEAMFWSNAGIARKGQISGQE